MKILEFAKLHIAPLAVLCCFVCLGSQPAEAATATIPFTVNCVSTGQVCSPPFSTSVVVTSAGPITINYTASPTHCSSIEVQVSVDATPIFTSGFLAAGQSTGPVVTSALSTGPHTIALQATGEVGGCNTGTLATWSGTLAITITGVVSTDPNFTPSILASGLSGPDGVVFRPPTGDLVVSQSTSNQISLVNATTGITTPFVTTQSLPDKVARFNSGLVAVTTEPYGPIDFYDASGGFLGLISGSAIINSPASVLPAETSFVCMEGLSFDTSGNLLLAAAPGSGPPGNGCFANNGAVYEFSGPTPWTATPSRITTFAPGVFVQDMAFSAAPPPPSGCGTLFAISSTDGNVYQIPLCNNFDPSSTVPPAVDARGIAIDPLSGDLYIAEFGGTDIVRVPAGGGTPTTFATGFSNTLRLSFDTNGNLYVTETDAGNLWKFTRNSFATALRDIKQGQVLTFTNPNPVMSDQKFTAFIPLSANPNGAAFLQAIFVQVDPATLDAKLAPGSLGDSEFFGGGRVAPGATCIPIPSANGNCVVVIQKCYDSSGNAFDICPVQEPSTNSDLIQLTFSYDGLLPPKPGFLIDFDTPPNNQTLTDITTGATGDPTLTGGTKGLCSQTMSVNRGTPVGGDFSLSVTPSTLSLTAPGSATATVTVTAINGFSSTVTLGVSDSPTGISASLSPTSVTPPTSNTSTLTVGFSVTPTIADINTVVGNLLNNGCIDNAGVANALTSKLSAAQSAIDGGQIKTAINTLTAFKNQVQAQAGKHLSSSCTTMFNLIVTGEALGITRLAEVNVNATFSTATVLLTDVQALIGNLKLALAIPDPITGFVVDSTGVGVQGAIISILDSNLNPVPGAPATTDATGFYYFATTGILSSGSTYTIQVSAPLPRGFSSVTPPQTFTWTGSGMAFNFALN